MVSGLIVLGVHSRSSIFPYTIFAIPRLPFLLFLDLHLTCPPNPFPVYRFPWLL